MSAGPLDPAQIKAKQRQDWDAAANGWKKWGHLMERNGQPVTDRMVELADIRPGHRVLDVACGAGQPALTVARRVGRDGRVFATDLSPAMVALARERAADLALENTEFREMDAESLDFPAASFDAALCRFGMMFLPNPTAAAKRIREFLRPGGRFVTATWNVPAKVPMIGLPLATIQRELNLPPPPPGTPSPFTLSDPEGVNRILTNAGFATVGHEPFTMVAEFPSADVYASYLRDMSMPVRTALSKVPADTQARVLHAIRNAAEAYATTGGTLRMPNEGFLFNGR